MPLIIPASQTLAAGGYDIDNSCRFDAAEARMHKTPGSDGNRKTWTISFWWKKTSLAETPLAGTGTTFFSCTGNPFKWRTGEPENDEFQLYEYVGGYTWQIATTEKLFRDPTAWYHILLAFDSTQATDTNRIKVWINGTQYTSWTTTSWPSENHDTYMNKSGTEMAIGGWDTSTTLNGLCAEYHLLDGTAVSDPDDFGERGDYGEWKPIKVSGLSYGTHGFYLDFADSSNLGNDANGGTDLTEAGITASDSMLDSPTNNFSTLNPLAKALNDTLSEGNLKKTGTSTQSRTLSTFGFDSGKWYFEIYVDTRGSDNPSLGISDAAVLNALNTIHVGNEAGSFGYYSTAAGAANVNHGGTGNNGGTYSVYTDGHIIGVALNIDDLQVTFYNNGSNAVTSGTTYETLTAGMTYNFSVGTNGTGVMIANFGQDGTFAGNKTAAGNSDGNGYGNFFHSVPSGFLAACSKNLTDCAVTPSENFSVKLYDDGAGAKTGVGFQPDLVWLKASGITSPHHLTDAVRGVTKELISNLSSAEATDSAGLTAFGADGFTVGTDDHYDDTVGAGMVAWCWKANGSGSSNEDGSINTTSTSVNVAAGFSISTYTGTGSAATVGHGLSKAPELVMVKIRSADAAWMVTSVQPVASLDFTDYLVLNENYAAGDNATIWNDTAPTSSVFSVGTNGVSNGSTSTYVAYCFHSVEGYSKVGAYVGNANAADGTFIYCGFKPRWIMCKRTNGVGSWNIYDTTRANNASGNPVQERLPANLNYAAEASSFAIDVLSNGFKHYNSDNEMNASSNYLFYAVAETPFKNANAR